MHHTTETNQDASTKPTNPYLYLTKHSNPYLTPTKHSNPYLIPTKHSNPYLIPTKPTLLTSTSLNHTEIS